VPLHSSTPDRGTLEPVTVPRFLRDWWIPDAAIAMLRICVAAILLVHGVQEHYGMLLPGDATWLGAPLPLTDRWIAATIEIVCGTLLAAGAFTRFAALVLTILVVLSYFAPPSAAGHWAFSGREVIALHALILMTFAIIGPGLFSLDAVRFARRRPRPGSGMVVPLSPWIKRQYRRRDLAR
jgi:putative oxidoreductase